MTNQKLREMHAKVLEIHELATSQANATDSKGLCLYILQSLKDIRTVGNSACELFEEALSQQYSEFGRDLKSLKGHRDEMEG